MEFEAEERPESGTYIHYIAMSMSNYVNKATMEFNGGERPESGTCIHYIAMSMSNYVNKATMEFGGGERPDRGTCTTWHCPCQSMVTGWQWNLMEGSGRKEEHTLHGTVPVSLLTGRPS